MKIKKALKITKWMVQYNTFVISSFTWKEVKTIAVKSSFKDFVSKSDSKNLDIVIHFFTINAVLLNFKTILIKTYNDFHKNIKQHNCFQHG